MTNSSTFGGPLLGCIADDFTGATDLASTLVKNGMRTVQTIGIPDASKPLNADAIVVALKSRTIAAADAVAHSLAALEWLRAQGCRQFFFKYCSTFDSTPEGNIGPVAEALAAALGASDELVIACPAFPENGRSIYRGHLFVGDVLLNESGMEHHPLTPMRDANIVRVLQSQTSGKVGLVRYDQVMRGAQSVRDAFAALRSDGCQFAIVDAVSDADLHVIGEACAEHALITGGSGVALGLPANFRRAGLLPERGDAADLPTVGGHGVVLAGSASRATNAQVAEWRATKPSFRVDPLAVARGEPVVAEALEFAKSHLPEPVLIYATATPDEVKAVQAQMGVQAAGELVEHTLSEIAKGLLELGVRRYVVAGGETSGAVVQALQVRALQIGAQIDPGVPVTATPDGELNLALKSGNFGSVDFFSKALRQMGVNV
ncbi:3-oxo-tetronate kinase [Paraburkholderia tropica]|uniref:3-oxo-tetronate kinase n=1 Tax=Paraburkholderia tropica TaxID=92647 RepID=UPI001592803C|nr:3-oxo-tetronate kinase [Paraburkholderia tropica]